MKPDYIKHIAIKPHRTGFEVTKRTRGGDLVDVSVGGLDMILDLHEARALATALFGAVARAEEDIRERWEASH